MNEWSDIGFIRKHLIIKQLDWIDNYIGNPISKNRKINFKKTVVNCDLRVVEILDLCLQAKSTLAGQTTNKWRFESSKITDDLLFLLSLFLQKIY